MSNLLNLLKQELTAQLPELAIALDTAPPPAEREIEAARDAVRAERDRLKQVEKRAYVIFCVLIAVTFVVTLITIPVGEISVAIVFAVFFAVAIVFAVVFAVFFAVAIVFAVVFAGAIAFSEAGAGAGAGAIAFSEAGAGAGAVAGAIAIVFVVAFAIAIVVVVVGNYLQKQYNRLNKFEQSLELAAREACVCILAWREDSVIASYCTKVVAERQFIAAEVEAMRVWVETAEQRKAVAEKQAKVDEACRALYNAA